MEEKRVAEGRIRTPVGIQSQMSQKSDNQVSNCQDTTIQGDSRLSLTIMGKGFI